MEVERLRAATIRGRERTARPDKDTTRTRSGAVPVATRGGRWVQTGHVSTAAGTTAAYRTSGGQSGAVRTGANGTVARGTNGTYVGHDGNVYRKDSSGSWSQYNNGNWNQVETSAARANAQQNLQNRQNNNLSGATQNRSYQNRANVDSSTMQGLDRSAASRQRGQYQTQRFQNFHRGGGGFRRR